MLDSLYVKASCYDLQIWSIKLNEYFYALIQRSFIHGAARAFHVRQPGVTQYPTGKDHAVKLQLAHRRRAACFCHLFREPFLFREASLLDGGVTPGKDFVVAQQRIQLAIEETIFPNQMEIDPQGTAQCIHIE